MKYITILMVLLLLPGSLAYIDTATGTQTEEQVKTSSMIYVPLLDCRNASGQVFAMDITKGQDPMDAAQFLIDLAWRGYHLGLVDLALNPESLECVDVLYISSITNNGRLPSAYNYTHIDMIEAFVLNGGGLLFTSDYGIFSDNTADLAERFTIHVHGNMVQDIDDNWNSTPWWVVLDEENFISSPIFNNVDQHVLVAGTSFVVEEGSPLIPIITTDDDNTVYPRNVPVMAAGFYGEGCVVASGDSNWLHWYSDGYNMADNDQLALNVVDFLTRCNEEEIPEFGSIALVIALIGALGGIVLLKKRF